MPGYGNKQVHPTPTSTVITQCLNVNLVLNDLKSKFTIPTVNRLRTAIRATDFNDFSNKIRKIVVDLKLISSS